MANAGAKVQVGAELIPDGLGQIIPQGGQNVYNDGGQAPVADLVAAASNVANQRGLTDEDQRLLTVCMIGGKTWAQAVAAVFANVPAWLYPDAATLAAWQPIITARAAMNPPYYPQ